MRISVLAVAIAACGVSLPAQTKTTICPKGAATSDGNTNNNIPYSWFPTRYQQIVNHDNFSHGTNPFVVNQCQFRMNRSFRNGRYGGPTVTLSMWIARCVSGTNASTYSRTFDKNVDMATKKQVINKKTFNTPKLSDASFGFILKFDNPTTIIPSTQRAVCFETIAWSNSNGNRLFTYPLDAARTPLGDGQTRIYAFESSPGAGRYTQEGTYAGCNNSNNRQVRQFASATNIKVGSSTGYAYAYGYINPVPCVGILGATPINAALGGGCFLGVVPIVLFPGTGTGSLGRVQQNFAIPNDPAFGNVSFLYQTVFVEPTKAQKFVSTRTIKITIGTGQATPPDKFTDGTGATTNYGLIHQLQT